MLIYKYANKNEESRSKDKQKKRWKKNMDYQISKEESDRIQFLRLIFSVMVVFIHSYTEKVNFAGVVMEVQESAGMEWFKFTVSNILSRCAVPGFFLISAVLFVIQKGFFVEEKYKKKNSVFVCSILYIKYILDSCSLWDTKNPGIPLVFSWQQEYYFTMGTYGMGRCLFRDHARPDALSAMVYPRLDDPEHHSKDFENSHRPFSENMFYTYCGSIAFQY